MPNWGGRRERAGRPRTAELEQWEIIDLARALTSGCTADENGLWRFRSRLGCAESPKRSTQPWRMLPDGGTGEYSDDELRTAWDDWGRERLGSDGRPAWAMFRFDLKMSSADARAAWIASERAADEREWRLAELERKEVLDEDEDA